MSTSVTIIVGVYNGEKYLTELLDSIISQSYSSWICICVDDGSKDASYQILKSYSCRDRRIKVVSRPNGGVGAARNTALDVVETPYVMFADQDDKLLPNAIKRAYEAICSANADIVRFQSNRHVKKSIFVWEHIFRFSAIKDIRFLPITGGEDTAFFWDIDFLNLTRCEIEDELYFNRPNDGSFSRAVSPKYIENVFVGFNNMRRVAKEHGMSRIQVMRKLFPHIFWFSVSVALKHFSLFNLLALCGVKRWGAALTPVEDGK
jgi:glycosyltransferase involved in cell wall biosynthesis